jgi:radical SAM superfamily enzyme YgiQ (UPF0313 family)
VSSKPEILMMHPSWVRESAYPLILASAIPAIEQAGFACVGYDATFDHFPSIVKHVSRGRFSAIAVGVHHFQVKEVASRLKRLRAVAPDIPILVCGPYPTFDPARVLVDCGADLAVRGDVDLALAKALVATVNGKTPPDFVAFIRQDGTLEKGKIVQETDLDSLPHIDRLVFPIARYGFGYRSVAYPLAAAWSSRGCVCACAHCNVSTIKPTGFRAHSESYVADEMDRLFIDHHIADVHFEDDCFFADHGRIARLCAELRRRKTEYAWELVNGVRPEQVPLDMMQELAAAGCRRISLGVDLVIEGDTPANGIVQPAERIRRITAASKNAGISTTGYFILGYPGRSDADDWVMVELSQRLGLDMVHYSVYQAIPGSLFATLGAPPARERKQVEALLHRAYRRFYLKPAQVAWLAGEMMRAPRLVPAMLGKGLLELVGIDPDLL